MLSTRSIQEDRIFYLDNLRYLMVLLVVVLHVACAYSHYTTWWAVNDDNAAAFDFILRLLGVMLMPTLFFIAGYFALPSLQRKGTWPFIQSKLYRLGIPCLIGVMVVVPARTYIHEYSRGMQELDLWRLFLMHIGEALSLRTGYINSVYQFHHIHFWFISLLLFFFVCFAVLHRIGTKSDGSATSDRTVGEPSNRSILGMLFLAGILTTMVTLLMFRLFTKPSNMEPWVVIASVLQFQPTRVGLYAICFCLGIFAYRNNWFESGKILDNIVLWVLCTLGLWVGKEAVLSMLLTQFSITLGVLHETIRAFLVFSVIMTLVAFGKRYWQSASGTNRLLAANSYTIYLIHMPIVLLVQLVLYKGLDGSLYLKFGIGSLGSLVLTCIISEFVFRRYPRVSAAGVIGLFAVLSVMFRFSG